MIFAAAATPANVAAQACLSPGRWHVLADGGPQPARAQDVLADAARRDVVLLGEHHDDADHHRWQLQTLAALHHLRPQMVIGFEAFPRRTQPVLDDWVAGRLTPLQLLERVEWKKTWNAPSGLYMPLFELARLNAIPMDALNVDRALVSAVRENGWDAVPIQRREGVSRAAEPSAAYTDRLFDVFRQHIESKGGKAERSDDDFGRFVQAQTTWDRAMAESIASRLNRAGSERPLVVGVMGDGHVRHGHGVPHQLRAAGVTLISTLLPVAASTECSELRPGLADAVFAIPSLPASPP